MTNKGNSGGRAWRTAGILLLLTGLGSCKNPVGDLNGTASAPATATVNLL